MATKFGTKLAITHLM